MARSMLHVQNLCLDLSAEAVVNAVYTMLFAKNTIFTKSICRILTDVKTTNKIVIFEFLQVADAQVSIT